MILGADTICQYPHSPATADQRTHAFGIARSRWRTEDITPQWLTGRVREAGVLAEDVVAGLIVTAEAPGRGGCATTALLAVAHTLSATKVGVQWGGVGGSETGLR